MQNFVTKCKKYPPTHRTDSWRLEEFLIHYCWYILCAMTPLFWKWLWKQATHMGRVTLKHASKIFVPPLWSEGFYAANRHGYKARGYKAEAKPKLWSNHEAESEAKALTFWSMELKPKPEPKLWAQMLWLREAEAEAAKLLRTHVWL